MAAAPRGRKNGSIAGRQLSDRVELFVDVELSGGSARTGISDPGENGYTEAVNKTTIQFDPVKRDAVAAVLGTKGLKATVDAAFDAVLRQHAGRELVRLAQEGGIELTNEEVERQAWGD